MIPWNFLIVYLVINLRIGFLLLRVVFVLLCWLPRKRLGGFVKVITVSTSESISCIVTAIVLSL